MFKHTCTKYSLSMIRVHSLWFESAVQFLCVLSPWVSWKEYLHMVQKDPQETNRHRNRWGNQWQTWNNNVMHKLIITFNVFSCTVFHLTNFLMAKKYKQIPIKVETNTNKQNEEFKQWTQTTNSDLTAKKFKIMKKRGPFKIQAFSRGSNDRLPT